MLRRHNFIHIKKDGDCGSLLRSIRCLWQQDGGAVAGRNRTTESSSILSILWRRGVSPTVFFFLIFLGSMPTVCMSIPRRELFSKRSVSDPQIGVDWRCGLEGGAWWSLSASMLFFEAIFSYCCRRCPTAHLTDTHTPEPVCHCTLADAHSAGVSRTTRTTESAHDGGLAKPAAPPPPSPAPFHAPPGDVMKHQNPHTMQHASCSALEP